MRLARSILNLAVKGALGAAVVAAFAGYPAAAQNANPDLALSKPWMKLVVPTRPAAGYFTLENRGDKEIELTKASSPGCGMLMLHKTVSENGEMKMVGVKSIPIKAGGSLNFQPGGYHLMCMQPTEAVRPGKSVAVTLQFSDGSATTEEFPVKDAKGK